MDIVSRLKFFMNYLQIANSQFADTCKIPRPTISQILNGRNKKISDELFSKIHAAYPSLSMMWLIFGEGEMINDSNFKISEPQNMENNENDIAQSSLFEDAMPQFDFDTPISANEAENFSHPNITENRQKLENHDQLHRAMTQSANTPLQTANINTTPSSMTNTISLNPDSNKKIQSIMVFYNDNSFEIFSPTEKK